MHDLTIRSAKTQANLTRWSRIVAECRQSGLTVSQWCAEHNINTRTFYGWQKKVFSAAVEQNSEPRFAELPAPNAVRNSLVATVRIGSASLDVYSGVSADVVTALCKALCHAE